MLSYIKASGRADLVGLTMLTHHEDLVLVLAGVVATGLFDDGALLTIGADRLVDDLSGDLNSYFLAFFHNRFPINIRKRKKMLTIRPIRKN